LEIAKKQKRRTASSGAFVYTWGFSLCCFCSSFSFCPPLFHHFGNTSFSGGAQATTATPSTPAIAQKASLAASPSAVPTFQSSNGLL